MGEFIDKAKGKAKEIGGVATNDRQLETEGKIDQAKGTVKGKFEEMKQGLRQGLHPDPLKKP